MTPQKKYIHTQVIVKSINASLLFEIYRINVGNEFR